MKWENDSSVQGMKEYSAIHQAVKVVPGAKK